MSKLEMGVLIVDNVMSWSATAERVTIRFLAKRCPADR